MAKVIQLVHESVHQNPLSNLMSTHDLRSTQGVSLTNFDSILSMLQGTVHMTKSCYMKLEIGSLSTFFILQVIREDSYIVQKSPIFPRKFSNIF